MIRHVALALVVALLLLLVAREARAERELIVPFHESGHVVLDQLAGLRLDTSGLGYAAPVGIAMRTTSSEGVDTTTTSVWFAPAADIFVTDHLSIGARVDVQHAWGAVESKGQRLELPGTTSMTFLPRVGFYAPLTDRIGVWIRAGVGWTRSESTVATEAMVLDADATVVYRFTETFFMKAGPEIGATFGGGVSTLQLGGAIGFGMNIEL